MILRSRWMIPCLGAVAGLASAALGQPFTKCVTNFEAVEGLIDGEEVLWQEPSFSGTSQGILCVLDAGGSVCADSELDSFGNPWDLSQVVSWFGLPSPSYEIYFVWEDPANSNGVVRATTFQAANLQRPSLHLGGRIRFNMAVVAYDYLPPDGMGGGNTLGDQITDGSAKIYMCLAVRETGKDVPQGSTDTGGGDIEFIYLPGSQFIPDAGTNGLISMPPGGKVFTASTQAWPPDASQFTTVEFDLQDLGAVRGFANDGNGVDTAGDGVLDATINPGGDGVNRGALEAILFTNDPADTAGEVFFIYIDDVEFESDVPDGTIEPPTVLVPVVSTDTQVVVNTKLDLCDGTDVDEAELFINDISAGTAVPVSGQATFDVPVRALSPGDILKATQTFNGVTSDFSPPAVVFAPGTLLADNFDAYGSQADMNAFWFNSIANPTPSSARLTLSTGGAATCQNMIVEANPAGADAARLYRFIGNVNGTDETPLVVTWQFQHRGPSGGAGERTRFELARQASSTFSASAAARLPGTTGIVLENGPSTVPQPYTLDQYNLLLISDDPQTANSNGFFPGNQGNVALTGIDRQSDVWHEMQIEVKTSVINYTIDGVLANPVATNGTPLWPGGVPRPNTEDYNFIIIGQGFSNNGPQMLFDSISITEGGIPLPFPDPNPVPAPTVLSPIFPGATLVTVEDVNSNASEVAVYLNGSGPIATTNGVGEFLDNTATLSVAGLSNGSVVTATQTLDVARTPVESCFSNQVIVQAPAPTVEPILVPSQTTVQVSNIEENLASAVTVYRDLGGGSTQQIGQALNPTTDPVTVTVSALQNGNTIVATQTIGGAESPNSAGVVVAVPAPTVVGPLLPGETVVTVAEVHPTATDVTVYVEGIEAGNITTTGVTQVDVPLGSALVNLQEVRATQTIDGVEGPLSNAVIVGGGFCNVVFFSDMVSSNGWTKIRSPDTNADFGYDYSADAIPPAPSGNDTLGLKLEANIAVGGDFDTINCYPTDLNMTGNYQLKFDFWMNYALGGIGTTEHLGGGVGYNGATVGFNGAAFIADGDGGVINDYRMYKDTVIQGTGATGAFYDAGSQDSAHPYYTSAFPGQAPPEAQGQPVGTSADGTLAFGWHTMVITAINSASINTVNFAIDGVSIGTLDANQGGAVATEGLVKLWYSDQFIGSVSDLPEFQFGLVDNVFVLTILTTGTGGDFDNDGDVDRGDAEAFVDCLGGPEVDPDPSLGLGCRQPCLTAFDSDADDDIDLEDHAAFQINYTCPGIGDDCP